MPKAKKSRAASSAKKDHPSKTGLMDRKISPRLRLIANGDEEVCRARSENAPYLTVADEVVSKSQAMMRSTLELASAPRAARKKHKREDLHKPPSTAKASLFVQFKDDLSVESASFVEDKTCRRNAIVTVEKALDEIADIAAHEDVINVETGDMIRVPPVIFSDTTDEAKKPTLSERKISSQSKLHEYGKDILVGIIDVGGIAFAHEDFMDAGTTRIHSIWDMGGSHRKGPSRFGYGSEFKNDHLQTAIDTAAQIGVSPYAIEPQAHQQPRSHATHVASIAAGNRGVCRNATIAGVMIDLSPDDLDRRKSFYDSTRIAHAVEYLIDVARELGEERNLGGPMPLSINISLGTNGHAHDGSSAISRWIDNALALPGLSVAVAAGNAGQEAPEAPGDLGYIMGRIHSSGRIAARGLTNSVDWIVTGDGIADVSENEMEIWYEPQDRFSVTVTSPGPNSEIIGPVPPGKFIENRQLSDGTFISIYNELYRPANGANTISIFLSPRLKDPIIGVKSGEWRVSLHGDDVRDGRYHAWIERDDPRPHFRNRGILYASYPSFFSTRSNVDRYSVSSLACGERILSIGNYDAEKRRANITSSQGPTRTERSKPEVLAPGTKIVAANGFAGSDDEWIEMTGTSMAAPYAAGVAGLMLAAVQSIDKRPNLTAAQIIGIMRRTARPIDDNDYTWKDDIGFGLIDGDACLDQAIGIGLTAADDMT